MGRVAGHVDMREGTEEAGWSAGSEGGAWPRGMGKREGVGGRELEGQKG